jgi:DNA-binding response OmpR family regulator
MSFVDVTGWQCSSEDTGEDIIAYLETHPEVDIFISEINLPSINGWELSRKIKERFPFLSVILYSADSISLKQEGKTAGKPDYLLRKPFSMTHLQNIIRETGRQRL